MSNLPLCFLNVLQNQNNSTPALLGRQLYITTIIASIAISMFVLLTNSMLIYGLYRTTKRPMPTPKKLFICLSCTDILTATIGVSRHILGYHTNNCVLLLVLNSISDMFLSLGIGIFLTITILRYLSLRNPFMRISNRCINFILIVETLVSILAVLLGLLVLLPGTGRSTLIILQFTITISYSLAVSSLLIINLLSFFTLKANIKHSVTISSKNHCSGNATHDETISDSGDQLMKNKRKRYAVKTLIVISMFYLLCNLPLCIYFLVAAVNSLGMNYKISNYVNSHHVASFLALLVMLNNGINAAIIIIRSKDILTFYKSIIFS